MEEKTLHIGIVGLGLIGGSFGRAFLKNTEHRVYGRDLSERVMGAAKLVKAVHEDLTDENLPLLDVLIFAVNPRTVIKIMPEYLPFLKDGCIVTDAGGNKRAVVDAMNEAALQYPALCFIGAHPMAGKEFSGFPHSAAGLFEGASVLVVPVNAELEQIALLKKIFTDIGFKNCVITSAEEHDRMIAYTSQLCHLISSAYCLQPLALNHNGFSAGSFRDLTRVARLNPEMWTELFCDNAENVSVVLGDFIDRLSGLKSAVEQKDEQAVFRILSDANEKKEQMDKIKG